MRKYFNSSFKRSRHFCHFVALFTVHEENKHTKSICANGTCLAEHLENYSLGIDSSATLSVKQTVFLSKFNNNANLQICPLSNMASALRTTKFLTRAQQLLKWATIWPQ